MLTFNQQLEEALDIYFPKNKCKERGEALVLFAQAMILYEKELKSIENNIREHYLYLWQNDSDKPVKYGDGFGVEEFIKNVMKNMYTYDTLQKNNRRTKNYRN